MRVLVLNAGSSSIKYELFEMADRRELTSGVIERIGEAGGTQDHREGFRLLVNALRKAGTDESGLFAVGHRVVHGGEAFHEPALIDERVMKSIREHSPLAPLHNPANLTGIEIAREVFPTTPHVAVFDTAFHASMPPHAYHYAIPHRLYDELGVRRYGFHGTSHEFVAREAARHLEQPLASLNLITMHLGNGASVCAIENGKSVDTSMGLTPLEGLVMGTRSGDLDAAIVPFLARETGMSTDEIDSLLNQDSGLKGLCGDNDMREIMRRTSDGDQRARLAFETFCYRLKKYIGAYFAVLGRVDALVFSAGIGENNAQVRSRSCAGLENFGIVLDERKNALASGGNGEIQSPDSGVSVLVIATDEELAIAQQTVACIQ